MTQTTGGRATLQRPEPSRITRIEQIPLIVPLGREYKGSYYSMTKRVTILTRVHTEDFSPNQMGVPSTRMSAAR